MNTDRYACTVTLTYDLLTSESNEFILVLNYT